MGNTEAHGNDRGEAGPAAEGFLGLTESGQASVSTGLKGEAGVGRKGEAGGPERPWGRADVRLSTSTAVEQTGKGRWERGWGGRGGTRLPPVLPMGSWEPLGLPQGTANVLV